MASPPFVFKRDGDRYLGRGATDEQSPGAHRLLRRATPARSRRRRVRFIWELEEEIGSPNFEEFLKKDRANLTTDSILVSDTVWVSRERPALSYGLRGLLGMAFRLRTGGKDVHSGLTGGAARNPFAELSEVIARCVDAKTGKIKIPGIYDEVRPLSKEELAGFLGSGFTVSKFMKDHAFKSLRTKDATAVLKAIWAQPTFEVHGWGGGYTGPAIKTIVPPFAEAKVSMRLVPNQDPEKIFKLVKAHVASINPDVEVVKHGVLAPFLGPKDGPYVEAAQNAIRAAYKKPAVFVREGGSIGAVLSMQKSLKAPILLLGLSLPEHGYHSPNEFYDWGQASGGMRVMTRYFDQLARMK
ncbi:MAG: M20/M25/M40 family metallo-hydrolase [Candidatus Eisenbacteria bacterium]